MLLSLSYLAKTYCRNDRSLLNTLQKQKALEKLRRKKDIMTIRPDEENRLVVMDRVIHDQQMHKFLI